jgi:hypothetical protein
LNGNSAPHRVYLKLYRSEDKAQAAKLISDINPKYLAHQILRHTYRSSRPVRVVVLRPASDASDFQFTFVHQRFNAEGIVNLHIWLYSRSFFV